MSKQVKIQLRKFWKSLCSGFLALLVMVGVVGCGDRALSTSAPKSSNSSSPSTKLAKRIVEVSPPEIIQELGQSLEAYRPQVTILSPKPNEVLQDNTVDVRFQVKDLPLFKNADFGLGPHLHVIVDNEPYQAVYTTNEAFTLKDLTPGTHTLRVFASRPWHESFKNEGAYAQITFHVFTKTPENAPDAKLPLLTYSRPTGTYGAEPVMLDFYLTNAPLHQVAQNQSDDDILDWQVRCTINGESFIVDRWEPIYLKGLKPGKNWVQLELLDEQGKPISNRFNDTARIINYDPNGKDTLSKLVRQELSLAQVKGIVDPNYHAPEPEPEPEPQSIVVPSPAPVVAPPSPVVTPPPVVREVPPPRIVPSPAPVVRPGLLPRISSSPSPEPQVTLPTPEPSSEVTPGETPEAIAPPTADTPLTQPTPPKGKPDFKALLGGFRRPTQSPQVVPPVPSPTSASESSTPVNDLPDDEPEANQSPEPEVSVDQPAVQPALTNEKPDVQLPEKPDVKALLERFRRSTQAPKVVPTAPSPTSTNENSVRVDDRPEIPQSSEESSALPQSHNNVEAKPSDLAVPQVPTLN